MSEFFTEWNGSNPRLTETTFSKSEGWELCELFKRFYILRETADMYHMSSANVSKSILESISKNKSLDNVLAENINKYYIPKITNRIMEILEPKKS